MLLENTILVVACLSFFACGESTTRKRQGSNDRIVLPDFKSTFHKTDQPAEWAPGHPKAWGSANLSYRYNASYTVNTDFAAAVTHDEKYLGIWDGYQVHFTDLDTGAKVATVPFTLPKVTYQTPTLILHPVHGGGWDIIVPAVFSTLRQRVSAELKLVGTQNIYEGPFSGAITDQGKLISDHGFVYDLEDTSGSNDAVDNLNVKNDKGEHYRVAPDGVHLGLMSWDGSVKVLNMTGDSIATLDTVSSFGNFFDFSPDGKYIAVVGVADRDVPTPTKLRVWEIANLAAAPIEVTSSLNVGRTGAEVRWSTDSKQVAVLDEHRVQIFDFPGSKEATQTWEAVVVKPDGSIPVDLQWYDGGKKVAWWWEQGQYLYDLDTNLLYLWTPSTKDRAWKERSFVYLSKRGLAVTANGDATVRLWKI